MRLCGHKFRSSFDRVCGVDDLLLLNFTNRALIINSITRQYKNIGYTVSFAYSCAEIFQRGTRKRRKKLNHLQIIFDRGILKNERIGTKTHHRRLPPSGNRFMELRGSSGYARLSKKQTLDAKYKVKL